ncbi:hypothetical protein QVD17_15749 [Tagetes erecta]|uniref:Uncharacterized protein n=1 Tax=Tagetes erecta TaxID=13708 RepID=A0AAD8NZY1_TARER|nr:hypothetical protein QVD17_15749 [Tagetes erecta]
MAPVSTAVESDDQNVVEERRNFSTVEMWWRMVSSIDECVLLTMGTFGILLPSHTLVFKLLLSLSSIHLHHQFYTATIISIQIPVSLCCCDHTGHKQSTATVVTSLRFGSKFTTSLLPVTTPSSLHRHQKG